MKNTGIVSEIIFLVKNQSFLSIGTNNVHIRKDLFDLVKTIEPKLEKFSFSEYKDGYTYFVVLDKLFALDFIFYLKNILEANNEKLPYHIEHYRGIFTELCYPNHTNPNTCEIKVVLTDPAAIMPSKERASDTGFDLTVIKIAKTMGDVILYDTCVQIQPSYGWYVEIVPRSSISKTGYMLANSVGIIDGSYRGNLMVALRKVNKEAPDFELPCRIAQMIPRQFVHPTLTLVESVNATERGEKGFGSSNK